MNKFNNSKINYLTLNSSFGMFSVSNFIQSNNS